MTRKQLDTLIALLRDVYPDFAQTRSAERLWRRSVASLDYDLATLAAQRWVEQSRFFPTAGELRQTAKDLEPPPSTTEALLPRFNAPHRTDAELRALWRGGGLERRDDGWLYKISTGHRTAGPLPPEWTLPPLPDGTRPAERAVWSDADREWSTEKWQRWQRKDWTSDDDEQDDYEPTAATHVEPLASAINSTPKLTQPPPWKREASSFMLMPDGKTRLDVSDAEADTYAATGELPERLRGAET